MLDYIILYDIIEQYTILYCYVIERYIILYDTIIVYHIIRTLCYSIEESTDRGPANAASVGYLSIYLSI